MYQKLSASILTTSLESQAPSVDKPKTATGTIGEALYIRLSPLLLNMASVRHHKWGVTELHLTDAWTYLLGNFTYPDIDSSAF